jgi:hypothetical protein
MAQYKVIQDIEAEDKLLGPLTLKQFIYAAITIILGFIAYKLMTISPYIIILFLPEMLFFGLLAAPFGIDQPNEVWLLAKFRFYLKPQIRKWDQDGTGGLVTVTAPKIVERKLTKDFTAVEAKGRLESLAKILDAGGWVRATTGTTTFRSSFSKPSEDRLVDLGSITSDQPTSDIIDQDDIFDESNLQARHINTVMTENERKVRNYQKNLVDLPKTPASSSDEALIIKSPEAFAHPKDYIEKAPDQPAFRPIESRFNPKNTVEINPLPTEAAQNYQSPVTSQSDNAKISLLARDNNRTIASLKREFSGGDDSGEVVISLH